MAFIKGASGNPGGQRKTVKETRRLAADGSPEAMQRLIDIARHSEDEYAAIAAAKIVIEQGCGKPRIQIDKTVTHKRAPREMSLDELERRLASLSRGDGAGQEH